ARGRLGDRASAVYGKGVDRGGGGTMKKTGADVSAHARSIGTRVGGQDVDVRVTVKGRAEVSATAQGEAKADLRFAEGGPKLGVDLGGEAFAGAKAEGQVQVGLGEIASVTAHGGAWAGAGAEGRARVHFDKGKLKLGVSGGAAAEAGAGGGVEVEVDVVKGAFVAAGAGLKSLTAPVRFALNPAGVLMDACTSARMALSLGTQLATIPGQLLQAAAG
ncbi:MAG: hypothetical protein KC933_02215, partial [Myxococcales bacterium]|nr:hypothetical protein [Myxococcales bacterium]